MKNFVIQSSVMLIACLFLSRCDNEHYPTYKMEAEFKEYVLFPPGTYWIYSTDDGKKDSIYIKRQEIRINDSRRIYRFNFEMFTQNLGSSFFDDELFGGAGPLRNKDTVYYKYSERYISNSQVTGLQFFEKKKPGYVLEFAQDSEVKYIGELDSYTIEGTSYERVRVFENLIKTDSRLPQKIYYARNVGVIRKELFNGQIWNLKRYFINK